MGKKEENFRYFSENHSSILKAYEAFGKALHNEGGPIEDRNRWLIKVAVSVALQHELALKTHIDKARSAGCSEEEIEHAILLTAPTAGFPTMMEGLLVLRESR